MFKLFKSKKEKQEELKIELQQLNSENESLLNTYCKLRHTIFIFKGFEIDDGKICVNYITSSTTKGYVTKLPFELFKTYEGFKSFHQSRINMIRFKEKLNKLGLELIETEKKTDN